jgi:hypothetical protein
MRSQAIAIMLGATCLVLASPSQAKLPKNVRGRAFVATSLHDVGRKALLKRYGKEKKAVSKLPFNKDRKRWKGTIVGFFKRWPYGGPITVWLYDKADKDAIKNKTVSHLETANPPKPKEIFVHDIELDPNDGLNKGRTYLIRIGQIVGRRELIYAQGEVTLEK